QNRLARRSGNVQGPKTVPGRRGGGSPRLGQVASTPSARLRSRSWPPRAARLAPRLAAGRATGFAAGLATGFAAGLAARRRTRLAAVPVAAAARTVRRFVSRRPGGTARLEGLAALALARAAGRASLPVRTRRALSGGTFALGRHCAGLAAWPRLIAIAGRARLVGPVAGGLARRACLVPLARGARLVGAITRSLARRPCLVPLPRGARLVGPVPGPPARRARLAPVARPEGSVAFAARGACAEGPLARLL